MGACGISLRGSPIVLRHRAIIISSNYLDIGQLPVAIRDQHSVPHGKLVAYKSYIYVIKIFNLIARGHKLVVKFIN